MIHARVRVKTRTPSTGARGRIRSCHAHLHDDLRNLKSVFNETITSRIKLLFRIRFVANAKGPYCTHSFPCITNTVFSVHISLNDMSTV